MMVHASVPQQLPQHMSDVNMPYILHACRRPSASMLRHCHHRPDHQTLVVALLLKYYHRHLLELLLIQ